MEKLEQLLASNFVGIVDIYSDRLSELDGIQEPSLDELNSPDLQDLVNLVLSDNGYMSDGVA